MLQCFLLWWHPKFHHSVQKPPSLRGVLKQLNTAQIITPYLFNVYLNFNHHLRIGLQGEHKVFPWLQTFITRKLLMWNTNIFFFQNITQEAFFTTHRYTSTCAPFVARRTSNRQSISLHVFSNMSSVIVAKASVILAFRFVISGNGVENTLSLTYPHKKKSREVISGDRGGQGVGPSLPIHLFGNVAAQNRRTCEPQCRGAPSCWKIIHGWNSSDV